MKFYIEQYSDLVDAFKHLREQFYPFFLITHNGKAPTLSRNELNAFFHAAIVPLFAERSGYTRKESKEELQKLHALVSDANGIEVESVSGMSYDRLLRFIDDCQGTLVKEFGVYADKNDIEQIKLLKTKTIP